MRAVIRLLTRTESQSAGWLILRIRFFCSNVSFKFHVAVFYLRLYSDVFYISNMIIKYQVDGPKKWIINMNQ